MRPPAALEVALRLIDRPASVRWARRMPLPSGILLLLELAAGDVKALHSAQRMTRQSETTLQTAAGFFIEQVLFTETADSYRILGCSRTASRRELRRHMALLVKWLHPDRTDECARGLSRMQQSIFVQRVTAAWENLKHEDRRAAYDRTLPDKSDGLVRWRRSHSRIWTTLDRAQTYRARNALTKECPQRIVIYPIQHDTLLSRFLHYLCRYP